MLQSLQNFKCVGSEDDLKLWHDHYSLERIHSSLPHLLTVHDPLSILFLKLVCLAANATNVLISIVSLMFCSFQQMFRFLFEVQTYDLAEDLQLCFLSSSRNSYSVGQIFRSIVIAVSKD